MVRSNVTHRATSTHAVAKGTKEDLQTDPPCHAKACAIQSMWFLGLLVVNYSFNGTGCLQKNNYSEEKCKKEVRFPNKSNKIPFRDCRSGSTKIQIPHLDVLLERALIAQTPHRSMPCTN